MNSDGTVESFNDISIIDSENKLVKLNYRNFIKLSPSMRYIVVGSSGISTHSVTRTVTVSKTFGFIDIDLRINVTSLSHNTAFVMFDSLIFRTNNSQSYDMRNNPIKIRICSRNSGGSVISEAIKINSIGQISPEDRNLFDEQPVQVCYLNAENCSQFYVEITVENNNYFNKVVNSQILEFEGSEDLFEQLNGRFSDNSLVEIDVYDNSGDNISLGKRLKMIQNNSNVISVNEGDATDGDHSNPSKYIRANGADTFILDLENEYTIERVEIWRRWRSSSNPDDYEFVYGNNFIYGLNENKEICYKFYDAISDGSGTIGYTEGNFGRVFNTIIED